MTEDALTQYVLLKELNSLDRQINVVSNQKFWLSQIAYFSFFIAMGFLLYHSNIFSTKTKTDPMYGYLFLCLLIPFYVVVLLDYKLDLSLENFILARLRMMIKIFPGGNEALGSVMTVYSSMNDYHKGFKWADNSYNFFILMIYFGICLSTILCLWKSTAAVILVTLILILATVSFMLFYFTILLPHKRNISKKISQTGDHLKLYARSEKKRSYSRSKGK